MAYILDDDGRALVADVKNFCEKEVLEVLEELIQHFISHIAHAESGQPRFSACA